MADKSSPVFTVIGDAEPSDQLISALARLLLAAVVDQDQDKKGGGESANSLAPADHEKNTASTASGQQAVIGGASPKD